jgi:hypothetical protein
MQIAKNMLKALHAPKHLLIHQIEDRRNHNFFYSERNTDITSFVIHLIMISTCELSLYRLCPSETLDISTASPAYASKSIAQVIFAFFIILHKILCLFFALKTDHSFLRRDAEKHTLSAPQFPYNWR